MTRRSWSCSIEVDPVRNIAAFSSSITARSSVTTASAETFAASSIGFAMPAIVAPRAIPFAASSPLRMPPVATSGRPTSARRIEAGVGIPQFQNVAPRRSFSVEASFRAR